MNIGFINFKEKCPINIPSDALDEDLRDKLMGVSVITIASVITPSVIKALLLNEYYDRYVGTL